MSGALLTDLYELNMAASYLRRGMTAPATFSLFVRQLPPERGFLVAAGLEACLEFLEAFSFTPEELEFCASLGFDRATLDAFAALRFDGDVWTVPEGRAVFAGEPLLEVTAPLPMAQLVETFLLNQVTTQTTIASKAARCRIAARDAALVDFSMRRTQGVDTAMLVARTCALVGFAATSNVEAARRYGLRATGTMAHSFVQAFATERAAFEAYALDYPDRTTFLVDTYDTVEAVREAIEVVRALGLREGLGVRLDSGDLLELSRAARSMLNEAGLPHVRIFASGGLDEYEIDRLMAAGAPVDAFGVGTRMGVSADAPYLDTAYKLVEYDGRPVTKLSPGKMIMPGCKQVFRREGTLEDLVGLRDEHAPPGYEPLLRPVMREGRRSSADSLDAARARFEADLDLLPEGARRIREPVAPQPGHTPALEEMVRRVTREAGG